MITLPFESLPVPCLLCDGRGKLLEQTTGAADLLHRTPTLLSAVASLVAQFAMRGSTPAPSTGITVRTPDGPLRLVPVRDPTAPAPGSYVVFLLREPATEAIATASADLTLLTPCERQVAHLAASGLRNQEIASQLGRGERTVRAHLEAIYHKLGLRSRVQLAQRFPVEPAPRLGGSADT